MARYTGPKTKICRKFGEPILGNPKRLDKNSNPPGMHGANKKRKAPGEYALQLKEKQKAKYTYGVLERQFRKIFNEAARIKGVTGENLIKLLEARLDNTVNGEVVNIPSFTCQPGDKIGIDENSKVNSGITSAFRGKNPKFSWVDWNEKDMEGTFIAMPERESVPENIKEQLIVELYSK
jgi:small subunit ribosomal protein S4